MACNIDIKTGVSILSSCPADTEQLLFFNAATPNGVALRTWATVKQCLLNYVACQFFGTGTLIVPGSQFDVQGRYFNSGLVGSLLVFDDGIPNFLTLGSEWNYIVDASNNVIGIQVYVGIDPLDNFYIMPDPFGCTGGTGPGAGASTVSQQTYPFQYKAIGNETTINEPFVLGGGRIISIERSANGDQEIIFTGTPVDGQVLVDLDPVTGLMTGLFTFPSTTPLGPNELVSFIFTKGGPTDATQTFIITE